MTTGGSGDSVGYAVTVQIVGGGCPSNDSEGQKHRPVTAEERATASRRGMDVEDGDELPRGKEMEEDPTWVERTPAQRHKANES